MSLETFKRLPEDKKSRILSVGIKAFSDKPYKDVHTDWITGECQISKGILFHYFGSKKEYYLYCLQTAMNRLMSATESPVGNDFYGILFDSMNRKMDICMHFQDEMRMVNMASRDAASEIIREKTGILQSYKLQIHAESSSMLHAAVSCLQLRKETDLQTLTNGLHLYINTVLNQYLLRYQNTPDLFFENREQIQMDIRSYLDLMLYGICEKESI